MAWPGDFAKDLDAVVEFYDRRFNVKLSKQEHSDLVALRRRLVQVVGESPTALRDLSVALNHVGQVATELGRLEAAEQAFAESLALRRRLP